MSLHALKSCAENLYFKVQTYKKLNEINILIIKTVATQKALKYMSTQKTFICTDGVENMQQN